MRGSILIEEGLFTSKKYLAPAIDRSRREVSFEEWVAEQPKRVRQSWLESIANSRLGGVLAPKVSAIARRRIP